MAQIAAGKVELYIRQLLSEALSNDFESQKQAADEKLLKDENCNLTNRRLSEKPKDK